VHTTDSGLILAATDLSNFLACPHRTVLDFAVAHGRLSRSESILDDYTRHLRERGQEHERAYLQHLRSEGLHVIEVPQHASPGSRVAATVEALQSGADVVYQAAFAGDGWIGYADILRKVPTAPGVRSAFRVAGRSFSSLSTQTCLAPSRASDRNGSSSSPLGIRSPSANTAPTSIPPTFGSSAGACSTR
jgi:hypothetical protein